MGSDPFNKELKLSCEHQKGSPLLNMNQIENTEVISMEWKEILSKHWYLPLLLIEMILFMLTREPHGLSYLLSALIQSLATVFALAFTITLIIAQMSDDHELSLRILLDEKAISFMIFFIFSIIYTTLGLQNYVSGRIWHQGAVMFSGACFFLLVPYFLSIEQKINRTYQIEVLGGWAEEKMENLPEVPFAAELSIETLEPLIDDLRKIQNFGFIAYKKNDDKAFRKSLDVLLSLAAKARNNSVMEVINARFKQIGLESKDDLNASSILASRVSSYAFTGEFDNDLTLLLVVTIADIGVETKNPEVFSLSRTVLEEIKRNAKEREKILEDLLKTIDEEIRDLKRSKNPEDPEGKNT